jgi:TnpA family transposase
MPCRSIFSDAERERLMALPNNENDLIQYYTFNELDLSLIRQRRSDYNRLGFAIQLCYLRYPGHPLPINEDVSPSLLLYLAFALSKSNKEE